MKNKAETEIILIRHGETQWNIEGRWQGHFDSPLTENGIKQADALARRLSAMSFSALYSSDLGRALHTAKIVAKVTGHKIIADERLRERNVGVLQGMTLEDVKTHFSDEMDAYLANTEEYVIPEGESESQRAEINMDCLTQIAKKHLGESIVVITHGGVLNNLLRHVLEKSPNGHRQYKILNTAINSFGYNGNGWVLRTWGDISHYDQGVVLDELQG